MQEEVFCQVKNKPGPVNMVPPLLPLVPFILPSPMKRCRAAESRFLTAAIPHHAVFTETSMEQKLDRTERMICMKKYSIQLLEISDVKEFVSTITKFPEDVDMISGRYVIDAKSIMGIFGLDLSKPLELVVHGDNETVYETKLKKFLL